LSFLLSLLIRVFSLLSSSLLFFRVLSFKVSDFKVAAFKVFLSESPSLFFSFSSSLGNLPCDSLSGETTVKRRLDLLKLLLLITKPEEMDPFLAVRNVLSAPE
jgi:hypothetical protein